MIQQSLKIVKAKLREAIPLLTLNISTHSGNANLRIASGLNSVKKGVGILSTTNLFNEQIDSLLTHNIYVNNIADSVQASPQEVNPLNSAVNSLAAAAGILLSAIEKQIPDESVDSINIKMPRDVHDLASLGKVCNEFDKIFNQLFVNETVNGQQKIMSVENGSIWVNLLVGNIATRLIGKVTWAAAVIYNKTTEVRANQEFNKGLKLKNEALEAMVALHKSYIDQLTAAEAQLIADEEFGNTSDKHEYTQRLKLAIKELSELIFRGAEIRPAISAPEQVSNLFPEFPKLIGVSSKIKEIEAASKD